MKERDMVHPTDRELSRRSFLKGTVLAGAGVGAMGALAACAPSGAKDDLASTGVAADSVTWDKETDIVVVGFGGAGSAAAIEARKAGAEVVILEASSVGGGSTALNGGLIYLGGTPLQKAHGIEDSAENFLNYMMQMAGPSANVDALKLIAEQSEDIYNWCLEQGIDFSGEVLEAHLPDGEEGICLGYTGNELSREAQKVATPAPRGHVAQPEATGMGFFRPLKAAVEGSGAEVLYEAVATSLITDENGRVIGVCADYDGGSKNVKANKAVILAGGGFTSNEEKVRDHLPYKANPGWPVTNPNEDGSCIQMAQKIGADLKGMSETQIGFSVYTINDRACEGILVDENGLRFTAEDEYGAFIGKRIVQRGEHAYLIVGNNLKSIMDEAEQTPVAEGATIQELAAAISVDADSLAHTVATYNDMAEGGIDFQFGKEPKHVVALNEAPFYAYDASAENTYYMTQGGLRVDLDLHVIDSEGAVIPGLYAAGLCSNLIFGQYFGSGSSMLWCFFSGRAAGTNAAAE